MNQIETADVVPIKHVHNWTTENIKIPNGPMFAIVVCLECSTYKKPLTTGNFKKEKE